MRIDESELRPASRTNTVVHQRCRAKVDLDIHSQEQSFSALGTMAFDLNGKKSLLDLILYDPFGLREAEVKLSRGEKYWIYRGRKQPLAAQALFWKWYKDHWWDEMAFVFGLVTAQNRSHVWLNPQNVPTKYKKDARKILCIQKQNKRRCTMTDTDLRAFINFPFLECQ